MTLIREPTFSKRVLENDVNFIEKYIHCSCKAAPPNPRPACKVSTLQIPERNKHDID